MPFVRRLFGCCSAICRKKSKQKQRAKGGRRRKYERKKRDTASNDVHGISWAYLWIWKYKHCLNFALGECAKNRLSLLCLMQLKKKIKKKNKTNQPTKLRACIDRHASVETSTRICCDLTLGNNNPKNNNTRSENEKRMLRNNNHFSRFSFALVFSFEFSNVSSCY